jgi:hypothetical protein
MSSLRKQHVAVLALALTSCRGLFPESCTGPAAPAIQVLVSVANTQLRPTGEVILAITDGAVPDTARYPVGSGAPITLAAGYNRSGVFDVSITTTGYAPWIRTGVVVGRSGRCDKNNTAMLAAALEPQI